MNLLLDFKYNPNKSNLTQIKATFFFQDEKYSHIDKADMDKVEQNWKEKMDWFEKNLNLSKQCPLCEDPVVTVSQIQSQVSVSNIPDYKSLAKK